MHSIDFEHLLALDGAPINDYGQTIDLIEDRLYPMLDACLNDGYIDVTWEDGDDGYQYVAYEIHEEATERIYQLFYEMNIEPCDDEIIQVVLKYLCYLEDHEVDPNDFSVTLL